MISVDSTLRAIKHLTAFDDTDIFPRLPELQFLKDKSDEIATIISRLQPGDVTVSSSMELLAPKGMFRFRIAHQIDAFDSLIYLASVIEVASDLEKMRVPEEEGTAFSYRFKVGQGPKLFNVGGSFHDWIIKLSEYGGESQKEDQRTVIETDISDFYQRIYHHRIENALDNASNKKAARIAKIVFKQLRSNQSFGLPVGQTASRILAEIALHDTDMYLIELGVGHTRYVDDFRIIVENEKLAHGVLCQFAEQMMLTEGLSLNGEKTHITNIYSLQQESKKRIEDIFNNVDMKRFENYLKLTYEDDPTVDESDDDAADLIFFDGDDLVDRFIKMEEYGGRDVTVFKALLKAIRISEGASVSKLALIPERYLYIAPRDFCRAFYSAKISSGEENDNLKEKFLRLLHEAPFKDLEICRYWILDLFVRGIIQSRPEDFRDFDFNKSLSERRAEIFLRGRWGSNHWFRARKTKFASLSNWERTAFAIGASCLPNDEFEKWVVSQKQHLPSLFQDLYASWLKDNWGKLNDILAPSR